MSFCPLRGDEMRDLEHWFDAVTTAVGRLHPKAFEERDVDLEKAREQLIRLDEMMNVLLSECQDVPSEECVLGTCQSRQTTVTVKLTR